MQQKNKPFSLVSLTFTKWFLQKTAWLISRFMAWKLMGMNSFDGGIWNVYFIKWQFTEEKKEKGKTQ